MSKIITSTVPGVELDASSLIDEPVTVSDAIKELNELLADNVVASTPTYSKRSSLGPCYLCLSHTDKTNVYYFKCNVLSITAGFIDREITIEASHNQLLKLFSYYQNSLKRKSSNKDVKKVYYSKHLTKMKIVRDEHVSAAQINKLYTHINGAKQDLLIMKAPYSIREIQYIVNDNRPTLKICI